MTSLSSVVEVMVPVRSQPIGGFRSRLIVSSLVTGLDLGVLMVFGRTAYQCASISLIFPVVFSALALGALASLGHMWLITARSWNRR